MSDQGLSKEFADNLFKQVVKIWLTPEVTRRREAGKLQGELAVWAVQVLFDPSGGESVRINDEVNGEFHVRAGAEEDALITHENLHHFTDQIAAFLLPLEDAPNSGHITLMTHRGGYCIWFELLYNAQLITEHIHAAREFIDTAAHALSAKRLRAVVANLHPAVEGMAKAVLLRHPDRRLLTSKKHNFVTGEYNRYSWRGNTDRRFARLLNDLARARNPARYPAGKFKVSPEQAAAWLEIAEEMYTWLLSGSSLRTRLQVLDGAPSSAA